MKPRFTFNALVMIYLVVVAVAAGTWLLPGGEYQRVEKDGRTLIVADSFKPGLTVPQGPAAVLLAPIKGFVKSVEIIVFLFVIGGTFMVIEKTGALASGLKRLAAFFAARPALRIFFIPVTVVIFSIAGSVFGMCEETMPFVLIFIPLALSLGYDSLVGTAITFLGAAAGFGRGDAQPVGQHFARLAADFTDLAPVQLVAEVVAHHVVVAGCFLTPGREFQQLHRSKPGEVHLGQGGHSGVDRVERLTHLDRKHVRILCLATDKK